MEPVNALDAQTLERLHQAGLRLTQATRAVLTLFAADAGWSPTHAEVHDALARQGTAPNRVTLYRLLDRLAACGVLDRHADGQGRAWRFSLAPLASDEAAAPRFECDACHRQFRLAEAGAPTRAVADELLRTLAALGHKGERVDFAVHGTCAGCDPATPSHS